MPFNMRMRPAPSQGAPPRYTAVVSRVYPYSLRPIVLFTSLLGFLWAVAMAVSSIKDRNNAGETSKEKLFDIIMAILLFVVAAIEAFAFFVALLQNLRLAKFLNILAPAGIIVTFGSMVVNVIAHFTLKSALISQCITDTEGDLEFDGTNNIGSVSASEASDACNNAWKHDTWSVFAWLIVTLILAIMFASVALGYYRQLLDPSTVRQRISQPQAFQMQPPPQNQYYGNPPPPPDSQAQQQWMVPPYPGPSAEYQATHAQGYEKGDYQPGAEWAQYAPPDGPPPSHARSGIEPNRAEDEAWERARAEGSTAHFTNGRGRNIEEEEDVGFVVPNREEDEAWARAREEGVTAHFTGQGRKGDAVV